MTLQVPSQSPITIGSVIADKYRVERIVGKGGMGLVVAARHIKLDETVAIKLMFGDDLGNRESVERFLREAKACVRLKNNEHVARVTDVDTLPNGLPYMVMELLDGKDLDRLLKDNGVFSIHEACSYVVQACRALNDAHKLGIIHRDLKPQNLFLTKRPDGSPCIKVLDFGISKHTLADESASIDLTRPSDILGSAYYMSPEQARSSRSVVPQSDIYSLGAVLYKLLTGRAPFPKKTLLEVYEALLNESPAPPACFRRDMSPQLEAIILRCLDKKVDRRFPNVHELMSALAPFTTPGETRTDDSDGATTIPRGRPAKLTRLTGTMPLNHALSGAAVESEAQKNLGIPFKTQPLDARSLHAALHEYLPPRAMPRPPAPSQPSLSSIFDEAGEAPTPRIAPRPVAKPAPAREEPTPRPPPSMLGAPPVATKTTLHSTHSAATHETIYAPALVHAMAHSAPSTNAHLPANVPNTTMTPWNTFPQVPTKSTKQVTLWLIVGGAITVVLILLVVMLVS